MSGIFHVFPVRLEDHGCDCSSPDLKLLFGGFRIGREGGNGPCVYRLFDDVAVKSVRWRTVVLKETKFVAFGL